MTFALLRLSANRTVLGTASLDSAAFRAATAAMQHQGGDIGITRLDGQLLRQ